MAETTVPFGDSELSALWDAAVEPRAVMGVAHGAGNDIQRPFFTGITEGLVEGSISVLRFNFPYMSAGRRYPDKPPVLTEAWRAVLEDLVRRADGLPAFAGGKSLGGRMASLVAAKDGGEFAGAGLVFFGYPLHAPGKTENLRDEHLSRVTVPMLFIQGTNDGLARFDLLEGVVDRLKLARLHAIEGADHSFKVKGVKRDEREVGREVGGIAAGFIAEVVKR
ncbi:MAG TPA: alpha/beta family hydrolase [Actinomycetota bacterium]|nr:alpha/beta family hydrolase [Actinomycetota bacterium]